MSDEDGVEPQPIERVLGGLAIPNLPEGTTPIGFLGFIKLREADGGVGWSLRTTSGLDDEEDLGLLVGYVHHATVEAANSWDDTDPTK